MTREKSTSRGTEDFCPGIEGNSRRTRKMKEILEETRVEEVGVVEFKNLTETLSKLKIKL